MKKLSLAPWQLCLLVVLFTLIAGHSMWLPITESSGETWTLTLENAYEYRGGIWLEMGNDHRFRLSADEATDDLLSPAAIGQEYTVTARLQRQKRSQSYYDVLALIGPDGTQYRTIAQSEAARLRLLPGRIALFVALDTGVCALLLWKQRKTTATKEAAP